MRHGFEAVAAFAIECEASLLINCVFNVHTDDYFFIFFSSSCVWAMVECHRWLVNGESVHDTHRCGCKMPDRISLVFLLNETRKSQCINSPRKNVKSFPLYCFWINENMASELYGNVKHISKIKEEWKRQKIFFFKSNVKNASKRKERKNEIYERMGWMMKRYKMYKMSCVLFHLWVAKRFERPELLMVPWNDEKTSKKQWWQKHLKWETRNQPPSKSFTQTFPIAYSTFGYVFVFYTIPC